MTWCGSEEFQWIIYGTLNPCMFTTVATGVLILSGIAALGKATSVLNAVHRASCGISSMRNNSSPECRWHHISQAAAAAVLSAMHLSALAFTATVPDPAAYQVISEAVLAATWIAVTIVNALAFRRRIGLVWTWFAWAVGICYGFAAYSEIQTYLHTTAGSPRERSARLAGSLFTSFAATIFVIAEVAKPAQIQEWGLLTEGDLEEALLPNSNVDTEAPETGSRKRQRQRSWVSLVGIAAAYMWPESFFLQLRAVICVVLIVALRLLNLAVPIAYKRVVDEFSKLTSSSKGSDVPIPFSDAFLPWVAIWLVLYFLQGGGGGGGAVGLLSNLRSYLWIPISQASFRRVSLDVFSHVLHLDHGFHLHRRTGELLRVMDRGTASMQTLLGTVIFQIGPAVFDIAAAAVFLALRLRAWIAIIVFTTLGAYIPMTIILTEWRGKFRRDLNSLDNARGARATDALLNYETVKLFGNEKLEEQQYAAAIDAYQAVDYKLSASMNALNVAQSGVVFIGLAAGMMVCTAGVADGSLTVGDAVLFVTLMQQLYAPLNFFGSYYRMLQSAMLDMEGIFDLLATRPVVRDAPNAVALVPHEEGYEIEYRDVGFAYGSAAGATVLRNISFVAPSGGTTALVGATGSGKSSLLRLLLRFYDPQVGAVLVGGISVADVTQASLRAAIGVVPQDTVLFNDTIRYNIRYGRPDASDSEVEKAAEGACIAETIQERFPLGYDTMVGERGLRLSGGEKQRVAFARALLKNPPILVLDEATSALDSLTERRIQATLAATRKGRTVFVVAHRLSTIRDADRIVVIREGEVAEIGKHEELVERAGGLYAEMWARQAEGGEASQATSHAALESIALVEEEQ